MSQCLTYTPAPKDSPMRYGLVTKRGLDLWLRCEGKASWPDRHCAEHQPLLGGAVRVMTPTEVPQWVPMA